LKESLPNIRVAEIYVCHSILLKAGVDCLPGGQELADLGQIIFY
jgi:hypothetical protein